MRAGSRKFVVEVKRGTNRSAFATPDPAAGRFREAEALLFGAAPAPDVEAEPPKDHGSGPAGGRILRSLVEPPPPSFEEMFPPVRRGRKPGSKNKPKVLAAGEASVQALDPPRRGRKPGSKNKPKPLPAAGFPAASGAGAADAAAMMRSYGFPEEVVRPPVEAPPEAAPAPAPRAEEGPAAPRARLRERSAVLRRYVLGLEPRPGQPESLRARRRARAAR